MAEKWVFVRGLAREGAHWGEFMDHFGASFPAAEKICLDLPGNGTHHQLRTPLSVGTMAEFVRAQWSQHPASKTGPPVFGLAISLGAMVVMEWAARYPAELSGIVLISPSVGRLSPLHQRMSLETFPLLLRSFFTVDVLRRESLILKMTSNRTDWSAATLERLAAIQKARPVQPRNAARQLFAAARYTLPLGRPRVPVLLLNSLGDKLVAAECCLALSRQWQAPIETHPVAGHDLPLDDPKWVLAKIAAWRETALHLTKT